MRVRLYPLKYGPEAQHRHHASTPHSGEDASYLGLDCPGRHYEFFGGLLLHVYLPVHTVALLLDSIHRWAGVLP